MTKSLSPKQLACLYISRALAPDRIAPQREYVEQLNGKPISDKRYEQTEAFIKELIETFRQKRIMPTVNKYAKDVLPIEPTETEDPDLNNDE